MTASALAKGIACRCPRCGEGPLFASYLRLASRCTRCGLDYAKADSGDGPAVFVIFIVGFVAVGLVFTARFVWGWSFAASLIVSTATMVALSLLLLPPFKATLIALQFAHKAEEGRPLE
ncbi:MAG: DUF983 domain-containing protein [Parvularculaceae bacterium]|nr:DUF983 domain-containing protein [Parvularculaceae bacterium]